ncbi:MAG TPA: hypothetical protein GXX14_03960 [Clostridiaceae bacterium]|nr:hypothetical protein [Clostridiaceae bacterium]
MKEKVKEYAAYYRKHILEDIMPFWDARCIDDECGGYLTCFDRDGRLTDTNKYIWFQGRQLYTYSLLYNRIEKRETWLKYAEHGYKFLIEKAYAGNRRWNYLLDRKGNVLVGTTSIFSDYHVIQGLAEYMLATGKSDKEGMQILYDSYDAVERNMFDPEFKDIYENTWSPVYIWHDMYLTCLSMAEVCVPVLGEARTKKLIDECLDKILNWFAKDEYKLVFEGVTRDNKVDMSSVKGRFINPGHMLESMWFCLDTGKRLNDKKIISRALEIIKWAYDIGHDKEYGGLISYADASGAEPEPIDWYLETNSLWDDKVWWANAEALCSYAMAYAISLDPVYFEMFEKQHEYCRDHFFDSQYGEWYERLHRDGKVKVADKGTPWKCAFHLVRALVNIVQAFEAISS